MENSLEKLQKAVTAVYFLDGTKEPADDCSGLIKWAVDEIARLRARPTEKEVARAICKSRTCEGINCCQWPGNLGRSRCPVEDGGYDDAARAVLALFPKVQP